MGYSRLSLREKGAGPIAQILWQVGAFGLAAMGVAHRAEGFEDFADVLRFDPRKDLASHTYCAGMVMRGRLSFCPVSASVKKNMTAVSARLVRQSRSSTQNQWSR